MRLQTPKWLQDALAMMRILYWVFTFQFLYNTFEAFRHSFMDGTSQHAADHLWAGLPAGVLILVSWRAYKAVAWGQIPPTVEPVEEK